MWAELRRGWLSATMPCAEGTCAPTPARSFGPVVDAVLAYDDEALRAALRGPSAPAAASTPVDGHTPLHYCVVQPTPATQRKQRD